ncbi:ankyrin repeat domain-containing protein [Acerihabitans sp. KWT182]|uniref:Ankyrin repeat domain-containing protein n=1 Tax=Acerihabitans sp. KWT182 TaxID=3157919 RepID=A0AAU7QG30_9GAMM
MNHQNFNKIALLYIAVLKDSLYMLSELIKKGANVNTVERQQNTALQFAVKTVRTSSAKILLETPKLNIVNKNCLGNSAYDNAVHGGKILKPIAKMIGMS